MKCLENRGLWPVDRCVFMDSDFVPSMVTDWPGAIQMEELQTALEMSA
jgi:hypothetical protein